MTLLLFVFVPFIILLICARWAPYFVDDPMIDALIEANRARPRPGMEAPDWGRVQVWGARNADAVARAEGRVH